MNKENKVNSGAKAAAGADKSSESIIEVVNLKKNFGTVPVIKDISFAVKKGEVLGIIGPSDRKSVV